jgi:hypothetical protein
MFFKDNSQDVYNPYELANVNKIIHGRPTLHMVKQSRGSLPIKH